MKADIVPISAIMNASREMKAAYINDILAYQSSSGKMYTREELEKKNLNRISEIREKILR